MKYILTTILLIATSQSFAIKYYHAKKGYPLPSGKEIAWMDKGKHFIREKLKDPESAKFKDVFISNNDGIRITCGLINSKNGFGAYTGYQRFVSGGTRELSFIAHQIDGFATVWNNLCLGK